jgi:hypothetical protein
LVGVLAFLSIELSILCRFLLSLQSSNTLPSNLG